MEWHSELRDLIAHLDDVLRTPELRDDDDDDAGPAREAVSGSPLSVAAAASNEIWDGIVARALLPALRGGGGGGGEDVLGRVLLTPVPTRPRPRGARRSSRTFAGASLRQAGPSVSIPTHAPRRLSTPLLTPFNSTPISSLA
jgi:hypothetical protein